MSKPGIKVPFFVEKRKASTPPVEFIVETDNYDLAHITARNQLILEGVYPGKFKRVVMAEILILKGIHYG